MSYLSSAVCPSLFLHEIIFFLFQKAYDIPLMRTHCFCCVCQRIVCMLSESKDPLIMLYDFENKNSDFEDIMMLKNYGVSSEGRSRAGRDSSRCRLPPCPTFVFF